MAKPIKTLMRDLPDLWDEHDGKKFFTVGRGKVMYCLWYLGQRGLYYCFRVNEDGYACGRRAVEPDATVFLHLNVA